MARFDIHEWRNNHLYKDPYQDTIETLAEVFIKAKYPNLLYENVSPQLKEGIMDDIKKTFNKLSTKIKDTFKNAIDKVGKKSLAALAKAFKGYKPKSPNEITTLIKIAKSKLDFSQINEVSNKIEFIKTIEELSKLSPDSVFKWEGETDSNFTYQNNPHHEFEGAGKGPSGLQKDEYYAILPGIEWENEVGETMNSPDQIVTLKLAKEIEDAEASGSNEGGTILSTLRNFFTKTTGGKAITLLMLSLGIMSVTGGFSANTVDAMSDFVEAHDVAEDGGFGGVIPDGIEGNVTDDFNPDASDTVNLTQDVDVTATDADPKMDDLSSSNVDLQNLDWGDNVNELTAFDVGEYELSDAETNDAASSLVEKVLEDINNAVEEGKSLESLSINIDYGGSVSNQGDADSNVANDGTNLVDGRTAASLEIAELAQSQIIEIITNQIGQDFADNNLEITLNEIDTEGGIGDQKVQSAADGINTQAAFQSIDIDLETGGGESFVMLSYQFAKTPDDEERPEVPLPPEEPEPQPEPKPVVIPDDPQDFKEITTGIRESQFAMIFQLIAPEVSVFSYLNQMIGKGNENKFLGVGLYGQKDFEKLKNYEKPAIDSWDQASDEELASIGASRYEKGGEKILVPPKGGWPSILDIPQEVKDLSKVLINLRKKPDPFIKKIGNILDIEFDTRHKAQHFVGGSQKGYGRSVTGQSLQEEIHPFDEMLFEAAGLDAFIDESNVKKHAAQILMMLGSMYASNKGGNIALSILNPEKLPEDIKKDITNLGFKPITTGMEAGQYVFLGDGSYSLQVGDEEETASSTTSQQGGPITRWAKEQEAIKNGKVFSISKEKGIPKGLENTKFYKDATKEGWIFKLSSDLPKGKYKSFPYTDINQIKKLDFNKLKTSGELKENMKNLNTLKILIQQVVKEQEEKKIKPLPDISRVHKLIAQFIDNRKEYEQLLIDLAEFDVPQKKAAIMNAFKDNPSLRSAFVKAYGDEKDTSMTLDLPPQGKTTPEDDEELSIGDIELDDQGEETPEEN
jgi:flagellar hook-basal body complex protein FliE